MAIALNKNISILSAAPIINSKASEVYVSVRFTYADYIWEGYVPIEYRRTGISIEFDESYFNNFLHFLYFNFLIDIDSSTNNDDILNYIPFL